MSRLVLAESDPRGLRVALVVDRRLTAIEIDRAGRPTRVGMAGPAKIIRTVRGLGALVKLADGAEMLLDGAGDAVAAGETLLAQVLRDQRGAKLGIASREVARAGRGLIHLPLGNTVKMSRRLEIEPERRKALDDLLAGRGGWIVRGQARALTDFELAAEAEALAAEGGRLGPAGATLAAPDAFRRLMSDHGVPAPDGILVAGREAGRAVTAWCGAFAPGLLDRVEAHGPDAGLFDAHDLDSALAALAEPRAPLEDGGSLIIEPTEALTAIDVNAGAAANILAVNLAAAKEIARQLVLRHIGGIVVIDFISMSRARDRAQVCEALKAALADDPARSDILPMSAFGLIEMTRERRGPALEL
jgi:ribonuclease E/ribonuclease G